MKTARSLKEIGGLIKFEREKQNLTQTELAKKSGLTQMAVSRLENGSGASLNVFVKTMLALNLELALLPIPEIDSDNLIDFLE